jgi:multidrug transporter EmrE-like cation transporter
LTVKKSDGELMMHKPFDHIYILFTILFTVYSQLIMRWQVVRAGEIPPDFSGKVQFVASLLLNPWIMTGIVATFLAGVSWMLAMTRFEVSYAFPFVSINYILVLIASIYLFNESLTITKLTGTLIVALGIIIIARG